MIGYKMPLSKNMLGFKMPLGKSKLGFKMPLIENLKKNKNVEPIVNVVKKSLLERIRK
jgi:hypothetical protein